MVVNIEVWVAITIKYIRNLFIYQVFQLITRISNHFFSDSNSKFLLDSEVDRYTEN